MNGISRVIPAVTAATLGATTDEPTTLPNASPTPGVRVIRNVGAASTTQPSSPTPAPSQPPAPSSVTRSSTPPATSTPSTTPTPQDSGLPNPYNITRPSSSVTSQPTSVARPSVTSGGTPSNSSSLPTPNITSVNHGSSYSAPSSSGQPGTSSGSSLPNVTVERTGRPINYAGNNGAQASDQPTSPQQSDATLKFKGDVRAYIKLGEGSRPNLVDSPTSDDITLDNHRGGFGGVGAQVNLLVQRNESQSNPQDLTNPIWQLFANGTGFGSFGVQYNIVNDNGQNNSDQKDKDKFSWLAMGGFVSGDLQIPIFGNGWFGNAAPGQPVNNPTIAGYAMGAHGVDPERWTFAFDPQEGGSRVGGFLKFSPTAGGVLFDYSRQLKYRFGLDEAPGFNKEKGFQVGYILPVDTLFRNAGWLTTEADPTKNTTYDLLAGKASKFMVSYGRYDESDLNGQIEKSFHNPGISGTDNKLTFTWEQHFGTANPDADIFRKILSDGTLHVSVVNHRLSLDDTAATRAATGGKDSFSGTGVNAYFSKPINTSVGTFEIRPYVISEFAAERKNDKLEMDLKPFWGVSASYYFGKSFSNLASST